MYSTVAASLVWGVATGGIDDSPTVGGDPVGPPSPTLVEFAPHAEFNLSEPETQLLVMRQLTDLFEPVEVSLDPLAYNVRIPHACCTCMSRMAVSMY